MPGDLRHYRNESYRLRAHPTLDHGEFVDKRDSFTTVYVSITPFLVMEYLSERALDTLPGGLMFPTGYLLFWAFYYTYYAPGFLEERLSSPRTWNPAALISVLIGVAIWFVKVTIVELSHLFFLQWIVDKKAPARRPETRSRPRGFRPNEPPPRRPNTNRGTYSGPRPESTGQYHAPKPPPRRRADGPASLPSDVIAALAVLGLSPGATWVEIHKRYRELAKRYHPDLNPDITGLGRNFIRIDTAYRKLVAVKARHFPENCSHG